MRLLVFGGNHFRYGGIITTRDTHNTAKRTRFFDPPPISTTLYLGFYILGWGLFAWVEIDVGPGRMTINTTTGGFCATRQSARATMTNILLLLSGEDVPDAAENFEDWGW